MGEEHSENIDPKCGSEEPRILVPHTSRARVDRVQCGVVKMLIAVDVCWHAAFTFTSERASLSLLRACENSLHRSERCPLLLPSLPCFLLVFAFFSLIYLRLSHKKPLVLMIVAGMARAV